MTKDGHVTHNLGFKYIKDFLPYKFFNSNLIVVNNNRPVRHADACIFQMLYVI